VEGGNVNSEDPIVSRIIFAGKDVLEVGCGSGRFTLKHLTGADSILGIDPNEEAINCLRAKWAELAASNCSDFRPGDITAFALPKDAFDIAVCSDSL
jgi:ubiquinone/menaquinone biosynthesis C-methylase UbiE